MIKYKKNFLTDVIIKLDFASPISELNENIKTELVNSILERFKIYQKEVRYSKTITLEPNSFSFKQDAQEEIHWMGYGKNKEKLIDLNQSYLVVVYKAYSSYDDIKDDLAVLSNKLFVLYPDVKIRRVGIRYKNEINRYEKNPLEWDEYITENLLAFLNFSPDNKYLSRSIISQEFNFDNYMMRFQYGLINPDFPARIKRKIFLLDFDCYQDGLIENHELTIFLDSAHKKIIEYFEKSITDKLKEEMNTGDE